MNENIYLAVIAFLGISFLVLLYLYMKLKSEKEALHVKAEELQNSYFALRDNYEQLKEDYNALEIEYAVLSARYNDEMKASAEKLEVLQKAKEELSQEFKLLANKIFEDKSKQFSTANKEQLELLLKPFREQITNFSKEAREQFEVELKDRHLLKDELFRLKQMNETLAQEALNLTNALKGENKTQGNWGELVLENILEQSGLRKGIEYELQATLKSNEGKTYRPDVIIHMPQKRDIIVDSKVSLTAYERFVNADEPEEKAKALKEHISSISSHIKELSAKKYEKLEGVNTLDFVLLFMPIEGAFLLALEQDGEFFKRAYENNILVVSPSTLLVTLRTIEHIWRTQRQEEHAKKIAAEAEAMYDKLVLFVEEMKHIGNYLQKTQDSYDKAMNRLSTGRGNVIKRAQNMKALGLKPKKELPLKSEDDGEDT
ncbi:DNA recombination protein RmuC [Sulfurimonas sediminis]|uniref:DNA recombination protein RmuC n=1 Tax=Sulfurimonas sediminis TaxID=2590020 RepID=A0A7M1B2K1_9BACT|nr:DNA recombination protein RmuC [Sulfurimonas sediminis]QOP42938.1 DNA recombination protein RmuC [Sulfurimonas sediminis]